MSRTVIVTGGSSGIGLAIARRFAGEGDAVTIVGRTPATVREAAASIGAHGEVCDVSSPEAVKALADRLAAPIDVLVAMAGANTDISLPQPDDIDEIARTAAAWENNLRANAISSVLTITAVLPKMRAGGSIITVSSIGAEYAATSYGAAKAAVSAWTAGISAQVGPKGITANTIAPGYIAETNFFADSLGAERRDALIAATHTKRAGTPEDVAGLAYFLASGDARQITGQTIHLNGGAYTTR